MRGFTLDNPHVRRSLLCPMCQEIKPAGNVVCWECHNITEYGTKEQREVRETAIEAAEAKLVAEEERFWDQYAADRGITIEPNHTCT
jgi:hypothetical protein